jgi:hypothetical protein
MVLPIFLSSLTLPQGEHRQLGLYLVLQKAEVGPSAPLPGQGSLHSISFALHVVTGFSDSPVEFLAFSDS